MSQRAPVCRVIPGGMAKHFCTPWFSCTVFISINPRCQMPLRLEAHRLPGKDSTPGAGPSAYFHESLPSFPAATAPQGVTSWGDNQLADAASGSLLQPWLGSCGGLQTGFNNLASHCLDWPRSDAITMRQYLRTSILMAQPTAAL